ncbi:hypothetical protein QTO34_017077, partial [Cnephaeus nilssonii]
MRVELCKSDDSIDSTDDAEKENFPIEFLKSITPSGMPCHKLKLKVCAIIMLLRNLNSKWGLCNDTRFIFKRLRPNINEAEVLTGSAEGEVNSRRAHAGYPGKQRECVHKELRQTAPNGTNATEHQGLHAQTFLKETTLPL